MESLSDTDLKLLETMGYLGIASPLTCDAAKALLNDCWTCLSARKRQEMVVAAFGDPGVANTESIRAGLELAKRCLTFDEINALYDYARYYYILNSTPV